MIKKKVPIWHYEFYSVTSEISELINNKNQVLIGNTNTQGFIYHKHLHCIPFKIEKALRFKEQYSKWYLLGLGTNERYQLHKFDKQTEILQYVSCTGSVPKHKKYCLLHESDTKLFLIGGKSTNQYEIHQHIYYLNLNTLEWKYVQKVPQSIKDKLNASNSVYGTNNNYLYIWNAVKPEDYNYTEITVYNFEDNKVIDSWTLKQPMKFNSLPNLCKADCNIFILFDLTNLYRFSCLQKMVSRLNRGIFLVEPKQNFQLQYEGRIEITTFDKNIVNRWTIEEEDLDEIDMNGENIGLNFYFNKAAYSDLVFSIQDKEVYCSRQLFEFYSKKLKKIWLEQKQQKNKTIIKLELKFPTFYFLIQQLYSQFKGDLKFDDETMLQLLLFSNKFQIAEFQRKCEQVIVISDDNFEQLYDFSRNVETYFLRDRLFRYFVSNYKQIYKVLPIGKVQEIVRCVYQPECVHSSVIQIKGTLYEGVELSRKQKTKIYKRADRLQGIFNKNKLQMEVCQKCTRLLNSCLSVSK